jgi:RNA polymerase sigma factor (sigma-70 family)
MSVPLASTAGARKRDRLPDLPEVDERAQILACQGGDLSAFEQIYRRHQQALLAVALRMLGRREDAEDAVQATLVRLFRSIDKYRFESQLGTYLMRILINVCYDMLESRTRRDRLDQQLESDDMGMQSPPSGADLRLQLEEAILTLPERMRACFVLFAVEGYGQKEIADMLDVRIGTVKAQVFQAKEKLRGLLTDSPQEPGQ